MLKNNLDFFAIAALALVLGILQAPRLGVRVAQIAMQQREMQIRNIRLEGPRLEGQSLEGAMMLLPPRAREKLLHYR